MRRRGQEDSRSRPNAGSAMSGSQPQRNGSTDLPVSYSKSGDTGAGSTHEYSQMTGDMHKCPVCDVLGKCLLVQSQVHKCANCGTEWMEDEKGGHLIV